MADVDRLREAQGNTIRNIEAGVQQDKDYREQIGLPIINLFGSLKTYKRLPGIMQTEVSKQVSSLVKKAKAGDQVAQQILTGVNDRLLEATIDTKPLPSLDWQIKDQPA